MSESCKKLETPNQEKIKIILCNQEEIGKRLQNPKHLFIPKEFNKLKKYFFRSKNKSKKGQIPCVYCYKIGKKGISRQTVKGYGLQNLMREIRQTISVDYYIDIDMVNSEPILLYNYCKLANYPCDAIKYYCDHRQECLDQIIKLGLTKDEAKLQEIKVINGGNKDFHDPTKKSRWIEINFPWYLNFFKDVKNFHKQIKSNVAYESKFNSVSKRKNWNVVGSVTSEIFHEIENKILIQFEQFLKNEGISVENIVLVFDGIMIPIEYKSQLNESFFQRLSQFIKEKTKYEVQYIIKPMNDIINLDGLDYDENNDQLKPTERYAENDDEASKILLDTIQGQIFFCDGQIWLKSRATNTYISDESMIIDELINRTMGLNIYKSAAKREYSGNLVGSKNITMTAINKIKTSSLYRDDTFVDRLIANTRGKIFFKNGYINFDTGEHIIETQDDDCMTPIRLDYDIPNFNELPDNIGNQLYDRVLLPIFGTDELLDNYYQHIGRAISGHIEDKDWLIMSGMRNCGKGVLTLLNKYTFGEYVNETSANNFLIEKCHTVEDPVKYAWLKQNRWTRVLHTSEVKFNVEDNCLKIDGNLIKGKLASGGDYAEVRDKYQKMCRIQPQCRLIMMCNDVPPITPPDAIQTLSKFTFPSQFIKEDEFETRVKENTLSPNMRKADDTVKDFVMRHDVCCCYLAYIISKYQSHKVKNCERVIEDTFSIKADMGDETAIIHKYFTFTAKKENIILSKEIQQFHKKNTLNISLNKLKEILKFNGAQENKHLTEDKDPNKRGSLRGFVGICFSEEYQPEKKNNIPNQLLNA